MTLARPYPGTQAVQRALGLLKAFDEAQPERGLSDLARGAGLNKTTTYRLLSALEREGLVAKSANGETYRLGPAAITLGARALRSNNLYAASRAELDALAASTGETATLEILVEGDTLILAEVRGLHLVGATPEVGTRWHAYATSTGKAILAHLPPAARAAALSRKLTALTRRTITNRTALANELERIAQQGYATAVEELEPGFVAIGAPIFDHSGQVVAAVSVGGPRTRLSNERIMELAGRVKCAAGEISARLGYREG